MKRGQKHEPLASLSALIVTPIELRTYYPSCRSYARTDLLGSMVMLWKRFAM